MHEVWSGFKGFQVVSCMACCSSAAGFILGSAGIAGIARLRKRPTATALLRSIKALSRLNSALIQPVKLYYGSIQALLSCIKGMQGLQGF
jgi:hypothetical protein